MGLTEFGTGKNQVKNPDHAAGTNSQRLQTLDARVHRGIATKTVMSARIQEGKVMQAPT
jgi:hypothetical protein